MIHDNDKQAPIPHAYDLYRIGLGLAKEDIPQGNVNVPVTVPPPILQDWENDPNAPDPKKTDEVYSLRFSKSVTDSNRGPREVWAYHGPVVLNQEPSPIVQAQLDNLSQAITGMGISLEFLPEGSTKRSALALLIRAQRQLEAMKAGEQEVPS